MTTSDGEPTRQQPTGAGGKPDDPGGGNAGPPPGPCLGPSCRQRIYEWACRRGFEANDAEDVCQEVCLRCCIGRAKFRGDAAFTTWLYEVMLSTRRDLLRKQLRREARVTWCTVDQPCGEALVAAQEISYQTSALGETVRVVLSALLPRQRQLLEWKYVEGLSLAEIAVRLGTSQANVRQYMHRARRAFAAAYEAAVREGA